MRIRGRVSERLVRKLRLSVLRRSGASAEQRAHLSAVVVQEVEPIGYFGGSLAIVRVIRGGTLLTSILFLVLQNPALALAALLMLPLQLTLLPGLQRQLNAKVRDRVRSTRKLGGLMVADGSVSGSRSSHATTARPDLSILRYQMRTTASLETIRVEIKDLKGRIKGLYNYTSNLTPFFFFTIGGYLVVRGQLSLLLPPIARSRRRCGSCSISCRTGRTPKPVSAKSPESWAKFEPFRRRSTLLQSRVAASRWRVEYG